MGALRRLRPACLPLLLLLAVLPACRQDRSLPEQEVSEWDMAYIRAHYDKAEHRITMRDGTRLFTIVYTPRDSSRRYPILFMRTPYGIAPYGPKAYGDNFAPSMNLVREGYIFVVQDVRGKFMSEGEFTWMAPVKRKKKIGETDESTDAYDTIDWLLHHLQGHNGRVGVWGGSYPGYYVLTSIVDAHPAVKAAIPSAPMVDLWKGDDVCHNGAFLMPHNLNFLAAFGRARPAPATEQLPSKWSYFTPDGYEFYLDLATLPNVNKKYFNHEISHWEEYIRHPVYDDFWQSRDISRHMDDIRPATLTIGGWFDAQDLYGPLKAYTTIESQNPEIYNALVMGPWFHGDWLHGQGDRSAGIEWGSPTGAFYRDRIELPFFNYYLKDKGNIRHLPEALIFDTGKKQWQEYDRWPPGQATLKRLFLHTGGALSFSPPPQTTGREAYREYISDPEKPVPYTSAITPYYGNDWMVEDQRFAARRPDVLVFQSEPLPDDLTLAGPITVNLLASSSGTDADFVVKVIDVFPPGATDPTPNPTGIRLGGYQMLLRGDPIRAKFRNSLSHPEPLTPNEPTLLRFELRDVHHTFLKGHRLMVQVQSSWFPMFDRNPHRFVDLFNEVTEKDFVKATQRVFCQGEKGSYLELMILE